MKNSGNQETPIIRMFGVTANSNSVAMHVHNFTPYFYVKVAGRLGAEDLPQIKDALNKFA